MYVSKSKGEKKLDKHLRLFSAFDYADQKMRVKLKNAVGWE